MVDKIILVGPKGRHLKIPRGFSIVKGLMEEGDLVANIRRIHWEFVDQEDVGIDASVYDFVIRKNQSRQMRQAK